MSAAKRAAVLLPLLVLLAGCTEDGLPSSDTEMIVVGLIFVAFFAMVAYIARVLLK